MQCSSRPFTKRLRSLSAMQAMHHKEGKPQTNAQGYPVSAEESSSGTTILSTLHEERPGCKRLVHMLSRGALPEVQRASFCGGTSTIWAGLNEAHWLSWTSHKILKEPPIKCHELGWECNLNMQRTNTLFNLFWPDFWPHLLSIYICARPLSFWARFC